MGYLFITTPVICHIKLTGYYSGSSKFVTIIQNLYFDPTLHLGWPYRIYTENILNSFHYPAIADLNKDGNKEIIVAYDDGSASKIAILEADGQLKQLIILPDNMKQGCLGAPAIGDMDNDGFDEIVVTATKKDDSTLWVFVYKYDSTLASGWPVQLGQGAISNSVVLSDLNKDGNLELIVVDKAERLYVTDNKGRIILGPVLLTGINCSTPAVGNFDDDKELEIVVVGNSDTGYYLCIDVFNLDGIEVEGWPKKYHNWCSCFSSSPAIGDIDGDGNSDIAIGVADQNQTKAGGGIYVFDRYGNILPGWPIQTQADFSCSPALADFNQDGKLEIVIGSTNGYPDTNMAYVVDYTGKNLSGWPQQQGRDISSPIIGDFNDDGKLDIINFNGGDWWMDGCIIVQNYDGTYITGLCKRVEYFGCGGVTGDIDNDGKLEFIAVSLIDYDEIKNVYKNRVSVYVWDVDAKYQPKYDAWPTFQHDNQRTGNYEYITSVLVELSAQVLSSSQIKLTWTDNYSNESGFRIERGTTAAGPWTQVMEVGADVISATDTNLAAETTYYYRVYAYNNVGASGYSNVASAKTMVPPLSVEATLTKGWNLISIPVKLADMRASQIFQANVVRVKSMYPNEEYYDLDINAELQVGQGYWIKVLETKTYTFTGSPVQYYEYKINESGWYLVGSVSGQGSLNVSNARITAVYYFDIAFGYLPVSPNTDGSYHIDPGKGYIVEVIDVIEGANIITIGVLI